jgi:MarR family transcriptional repressor of emrRAB
LSSLTEQIAAVEEGLNNLQKRLDSIPVTEILISRLLINLGKEMSNILDQRLRPSGLTEPEFKVLVSIYASGEDGANPGDLCAGIGQSPANITRITDALVDRGLISRVPDTQDRRRLLLHVTPPGSTLIKKLMPMMTEGARKNYRDFSKTDLKRLLADLKQLAGAVDRNIESLEKQEGRS